MSIWHKLLWQTIRSWRHSCQEEPLLMGVIEESLLNRFLSEMFCEGSLFFILHKHVPHWTTAWFSHHIIQLAPKAPVFLALDDNKDLLFFHTILFVHAQSKQSFKCLPQNLLSILPEVIALLDTNFQLQYNLLCQDGKTLLNPTATSGSFQIPRVPYVSVVVSKSRTVYLGKL